MSGGVSVHASANSVYEFYLVVILIMWIVLMILVYQETKDSSLKRCFLCFVYAAKASAQCFRSWTPNSTNQLIASATSIMIVVYAVDILCAKRINISEQMKNWLDDITRAKTNLIQVIEWKHSDCHLFVRTIYHFHISFYSLLLPFRFVSFHSICCSLCLSHPLSVPSTISSRLVVSVANTSESI